MGCLRCCTNPRDPRRRDLAAWPQHLQAVAETFKQPTFGIFSEAVAPELSSGFARGELAAVHDILGKLAGITVRNLQATRVQAQATDGNGRFAERAGGAGLVLPADDGSISLDLPAAQARTCALIDWIDEAGPFSAP